MYRRIVVEVCVTKVDLLSGRVSLSVQEAVTKCVITWCACPHPAIPRVIYVSG